jgi:hypothetical protein
VLHQAWYIKEDTEGLGSMYGCGHSFKDPKTLHTFGLPPILKSNLCHLHLGRLGVTKCYCRQAWCGDTEGLGLDVWILVILLKISKNPYTGPPAID